jgi:hypothetical protein
MNASLFTLACLFGLLCTYYLDKDIRLAIIFYLISISLFIGGFVDD